MNRAEIKLREVQREFKSIQMKWDTSCELNPYDGLGFASKIGKIKGTISIWLSEDYIGQMSHDVYEAYSKLDTDVQRLEAEIDREFLN